MILTFRLIMHKNHWSEKSNHSRIQLGLRRKYLGDNYCTPTQIKG